MTSVQKWKPGDVARIVLGSEGRQFLAEVRRDFGKPQWFGSWNGFSVELDSDQIVEATPLIVIDPESNEDRDRLAKALVEAMHRAGDEASAARGVHPATVGSALREFASPTPRIEEPTGVGAVVEAIYDNTYLLAYPGEEYPWMHVGIGSRCKWNDLAAVRILSPGVEVDQ